MFINKEKNKINLIIYIFYYLVRYAFNGLKKTKMTVEFFKYCIQILVNSHY